ncbi:MAG: RNA polymerase factor sigma-54 [Candidatus Hatepunaea meridiana]|nr:RNA polymerase factor sigma-54 [Candidatus Hatepunaea meridiana]
MLGLRQDVRLRQELTLQPQQILRSELIQMPLLELELRVLSELELNPFLEEVDPSEDNPEAGKEDVRNSAATKDDVSEDDEASSEAVEKPREIEWENILNDTDHWEYRTTNRSSIIEDYELPQPHIPTLSDHLYEQLRLNSLADLEILIGEEIIGNINQDGYLSVSLEDIAESTGSELEEVSRVHKTIMEFEPIGIAARDLRECLLIQLNHNQVEFRQVLTPDETMHLANDELGQALTPDAAMFTVTTRMISEFWKDFINKRFEILADKLEVDINDINTAYEVITKLNPKPGEGYFDEKQNYVIPDLIVVKVGKEFEPFLNDGDLPSFYINNAYREMYVNQSKKDKKVREYLSSKLESARWFINAIHQRRTTMLHTMRSIIEHQIEFFEKGPSMIKPMILEVIAEDIGMDISTISRVTNGKYVQTDWGIFELKYFFSEKMKTTNGEEVSNRIIKTRLSDLIEDENKRKPYSDQELTGLLNEEGYQIRRRTVAKYREQLRIPIKRLRRQI